MLITLGANYHENTYEVLFELKDGLSFVFARGSPSSKYPPYRSFEFPDGEEDKFIEFISSLIKNKPPLSAEKNKHGL